MITMSEYALICTGPSFKHLKESDIAEPRHMRMGVNSAVKGSVGFRWWFVRDFPIPVDLLDAYQAMRPQPQLLETFGGRDTVNHLNSKYPWLTAGNFTQRAVFLALLALMEFGAKQINVYCADMAGDAHGRRDGWAGERLYFAWFIRAAKAIDVKIRRVK